MTRSGDELAANAGQPCQKGQNRSKMLALEAVNDGCRTKEHRPTVSADRQRLRLTEIAVQKKATSRQAPRKRKVGGRSRGTIAAWRGGYGEMSVKTGSWGIVRLKATFA
jgi:hypothetical protein